MVFEMDYNQVLEHVQINNIVLAAAGDGVVSGLDVTEKGTPDMSVDVAAGSCKVAGIEYTETGVTNVAITAAHATLARKDLIIYDVATTDPIAIAGTPAATPIPPDIAAGDILLAIVDVAATVTTITNSDITDCIVIISKLDDFATPSDITTLNASTATHGLLKKLSKSASEYMNGQGNWATPAGSGDMTKAVYDPNDDEVIALAQLDALVAATTGFTMSGAINMGDKELQNCNNLQAYDTSGIAFIASATGTSIKLASSSFSFEALAAASMGNKRITLVANPTSAQDAATKSWVDAHNWAATDITSGTLSVSRGGTGVTSSSSVADVNATKVDGCDAGIGEGNVYKIPTGLGAGAIIYCYNQQLNLLLKGTSGYQLTTHSTGAPTWEPHADLIFSDTHCPKCGQAFKDGDDLALHMIGHNEVGDILTLPMHQSCANQPKKTVTLQRKVMEDQYILDEETGELKVQWVVKTSKKTVTRHKLKEGYVIDGVTRKAHTVDDKGVRGKTTHDFTDAIEEIETTIDEVMYRDVEYEM